MKQVLILFIAASIICCSPNKKRKRQYKRRSQSHTIHYKDFKMIDGITFVAYGNFMIGLKKKE